MSLTPRLDQPEPWSLSWAGWGRAWRVAIAVLPIYLALRILVLARFDREVALEIVRQMGVSGIAEAALSSLFVEAIVLLFLGGVVVSVLLQTRHCWALVGPRTDPRTLGILRVLVPLLTLVPFLLSPWTVAVMAVLAIVLLGAFAGLDRASDGIQRPWAAALAVTIIGLILLLGLAPLVNTPWLPHERVVATDGTVHDGFVLGQEGDFTAVLLSGPSGDDPAVVMLGDVGARTLCARPDSLLRLDARPLFNVLLSLSPDMECPKVPELDQDAPVACVASTGAVSYKSTPSCDIGDMEVPLESATDTKGPPGDKGPRGDKGPTGDRGPRGDKGPEGDRGQRGKRGPEGDEGPPGDPGPRGDSGPQGDRGEQGPRGPRGPRGWPAQPSSCTVALGVGPAGC